MNTCLLTIIAAPALEESLVDWLLENPQITGFTSRDCYGHGSRPSLMSMLEQVAGRQRKVEFIVETTPDIAEQLIADLSQKFAGTGLHYLLTPVLRVGRC